MIPITISSLTNPPLSMMDFACFPISVPAATAPAYPFHLGDFSVMFARNIAHTHTHSAMTGSYIAGRCDNEMSITSQHVSGAEVCNSELRDYSLRVSALASSGRAHDDHNIPTT